MVITWRPLKLFALTLRLALMMGDGAVISKARTIEGGSSEIGASILPAGFEVGRSTAGWLTSALFPRRADLTGGFLIASACCSLGCSGAAASGAAFGAAGTTTMLASFSCGWLICSAGVLVSAPVDGRGRPAANRAFTVNPFAAVWAVDTGGAVAGGGAAAGSASARLMGAFLRRISVPARSWIESV